MASGIQFAEQLRNRSTITSRPMRFDMICEANGIEPRLTRSNHPWTNAQVERMNRTIKEATVKRFHSDSHDQRPLFYFCLLYPPLLSFVNNVQ